jgi:hypothetical protein
LKVEVRRKQLGNRLTLNNGGPLGIQSLREIVIASAEFEKDSAKWKRLLGEPTASGRWNVGAGPSIRLIRGTEGKILEIVFAIKSLDTAKNFLKKNQWIRAASPNEIILNAPQIQSIKIRLSS